MRASESPAAGQDLRAAYTLWADTYPAVPHNPLMQLEQFVVESVLGELSPQRALDIGTGSGRYLPVLRAAGAASVVGADFTLAMLQACDSCRAPLVCADARQLPFAPDAFDLINASLMAGDVADLRAWAREIARVLTPGGHFVYSDFHPSWAARGWQRTFHSRDGAVHALDFVTHTLDDHRSALEGAGLDLVAMREPRLDGGATSRGLTRFRRTPPVLVVVHATKAS